MTKTADALLNHIDAEQYPLAPSLIPVVTGPVHWSSAGFPYLDKEEFQNFRDSLPWLLRGGASLRATADHILQVSQSLKLSGQPALELALRVVRTVLNSAAITAPSDLWLLRQVLATLLETGITERLIRGDTIRPDDDDHGLDPKELAVDLSFLMSRGYLIAHDDGMALSAYPQAERVFSQLSPVPHGPLAQSWASFFQGNRPSPTLTEAIPSLQPPTLEKFERNHWMASWYDIETGYRLVPLVLGLERAGWTQDWDTDGSLSEQRRATLASDAGRAALSILAAAGIIDSMDTLTLTPTGKRVLERGAGPFGIIEAYHPYMTQLPAILSRGRGQIHVERAANVAASQLANSRSFALANDALDAFCNETGFSYRVYIEHALGRGEATRQRFERDGYDRIYVGADLEDASIESARTEQAAERLPATMHFIAGADIGRARDILDPLADLDIAVDGAVMVVGNGFHEVRGQTDARVTDVFREYHDAGILLIFTEESALSVSDLLETAWNTYHAGFKYVHERSGQGLRPARDDPFPGSGPALPASWHRCATRAGYVCAEPYCRRSRTIFPYRPKSGFNPAISVTHFFVPGPIAKRLDLPLSPR
ncbi:MAG: hypothetical protein VX834_13225 [Myxococcota bacterium]|nr:hypothetical protein [Myxococcota bacterium]